MAPSFVYIILGSVYNADKKQQKNSNTNSMKRFFTSSKCVNKLIPDLKEERQPTKRQDNGVISTPSYTNHLLDIVLFQKHVIVFILEAV